MITKIIADTSITIDWLSFTHRFLLPEQVIDSLGLADMPWVHAHGSNGYRDRLQFAGISIHYNGQEGMGTWCEMTGQGCRTYEELSQVGWKPLIYWLASGDCNANVTRLDIACDDRSGTLPLSAITRDVRLGNYVSKAKAYQLISSGKKDEVQGTTVVIGSPKSLVRIRIYDKAAEQHRPADEHWVRCELQLRGDRALAFLEKASEDGFGVTYAGVLLNYLRFATPRRDDKNKSRWPIRRYWRKFIGKANRISIYAVPGMDYSEEQCCNFVFQQAGNAIDAIIKMYGLQRFQYLLENRNVRPNPKYLQLVEHHRAKNSPAIKKS